MRREKPIKLTPEYLGDFNFLEEMKTRLIDFKKRKDPTQLDMVLKMIEDWQDDLLDEDYWQDDLLDED